MQPNQSAPPAPPPVEPSQKSNGSQYEFIMNPDSGKSGKRLLGGSKKTRIAIVAVGLSVLLVLALVFSSFLSSAGKENIENLVTAAKQQNDLIRISEIGIDKARGQAAKNIAITTKLSLQSQQDEMLSALAGEGRKLSKADLAQSADKKVDALLNEAEQNNRFDEVFLEVMQAKLEQYQKSVDTVYRAASNKKLKAALVEQYKSANTLAGVAAGTSD